MADKATGKRYQLLMEDRDRITLNGVKKVQSFDTKEIVLETELGMLSLKGEQLGIKHLDLKEGAVEVEGHIDALIYPRRSKDGSRQGIWDRIFR